MQTRTPLRYTFADAERARNARIANGEPVPLTPWERRALANGHDPHAGLRPEPTWREKQAEAMRRR